MAHSSAETAIKDVLHQMDVCSYSVIIVWKKDYERWKQEIVNAVDLKRYMVLDIPQKRTKNQYVIAEKKV